MAFSSVPTITTGDVATAAWGNTYIKNNFALTAPAVLTAQGDIVIASGANTPIRLAKDANSTRSLTNTGGGNNAPAWAQVALATGVSGRLPVANGGTNATALTDKAVLISQDSGTDTVGSVGLTTSGHVIIGGSSGPAAATLTGGTGISISNGDGSITVAATDPGAPQANQAALEAETNEDTYAPPDLMKYHPGIAKAWCSISEDGTLESPDYNIASVGDTGEGDRDVNYTIAFSGAIYAVGGGMARNNGGATWRNHERTTADVHIQTANSLPDVDDEDTTHIWMGDQ